MGDPFVHQALRCFWLVTILNQFLESPRHFWAPWSFWDKGSPTPWDFPPGLCGGGFVVWSGCAPQPPSHIYPVFLILCWNDFLISKAACAKMAYISCFDKVIELYWELCSWVGFLPCRPLFWICMRILESPACLILCQRQRLV